MMQLTMIAWAIAPFIILGAIGSPVKGEKVSQFVPPCPSGNCGPDGPTGGGRH